MERDEEDGLGKLVPIFFFVEFLFSPWGVYISTRFGPDCTTVWRVLGMGYVDL